MSDFKSFKKADLAEVAKKVGIPVRSKDTKGSLLEKIELFIEENPEKARDLIESAGDDIEVATLVEADATEDEDDEETAAEEDKDYDAPPPINLKEWIVDPAINFFELSYDSVLKFTDSVGITAVDFNDDLRDNVSKTVTLNYLELTAEASYFLYFYLPLVPVKHNATVHKVVKDYIPCLKTCTFPVPDVTALFSCAVASVFLNWLVYSVLLPLGISYYVNFTRRTVVVEDDEGEEESFVVRLHKYDPFVFALVKTVIFYYIYKHGALSTIDSYQGIFHALKSHLLIQLGVYHRFVSGLGNFPFILGVANVVIGLYSQFEDF